MIRVFIYAVLAVALYDAVMLTRSMRQTASVAAQSAPFQVTGSGSGARLLVIGDSTAVGTGGTPTDSVAGRLARRLPGLSIVNRARNGARVADLAAQLPDPSAGLYDAILIQVGGNDVLMLTGMNELRRAIRGALVAAKQQASYVVLMSTGDVGASPGLPWPIDRYWSWRFWQVQQVFIEESRRSAVDYVDLAQDDPFGDDPDRYYARDGVHPSGAGYEVWFERLVRESRILAVLSTVSSVQ